MTILLAWALCQDADELVRRGTEKLDAKDAEGAIADFTKALEIDPKHVASIRNRGYLLYNLRRWKEALADFRATGDSEAVRLEIGPRDSVDSKSAEAEIKALEKR